MKKEQFLKVAHSRHFFDEHDKVLVAVSGGRDSMALLHLLKACQSELEIELGIAHVHHGQRLESDQEEVFLMELAQDWQLPIYTKRFRGSFSEESAREFRYRFFRDIMELEGYTALVTAHHADDQAETVLMRLIRGSRFLDLKGIQEVQPFGHGQLIRPFLSFSKTELNPPFYFEDSSNQDRTYFRNRVRQDYLPVLSQENPQFSQHLQKFAQEVATLQEALSDLTKGLEVTDMAVFAAQTPAVQSVLLQQYLGQLPDLQLSKAQVEEILHILRTKANYQAYLKSGYYLFKDYKQFLISNIQPQTDGEKEEFVVKSAGSYVYQDALITLDEELPDADMVLYVQKDIPVVLRNRQAGDRILVNGVDKKVRRYLIDQKINYIDRQKAFIIQQADNIYGIFNIMTSDLSKSLKHDTIKSILSIKWKK